MDERVELYLKVKNVQKLQVKVFEFNTLTYYRKNLKPFDTSIDLDGVESSLTTEHLYPLETYPSNFLHEEVFRFDKLAGKVGLFVVEFLGNGVSSRAVVKKGSLSLIHKSTSAGH